MGCLILEWNGGKFETLGPSYCICGVLLMSDSLSSVWGQSVHFTKLMMFTFSKGYFSHIFFLRFLWNFMINMVVVGEYRVLICWRLAKKYKFYGTLKCLLTQDHIMGLEISKGCLLQCLSNLIQTLWGHWLPWRNTGSYMHLSWQ